MIKKWVIYKISNPLGKIYIGRTSDLKRRLWAHFNKNAAWRNKYLAASVAEFGKSAHSFEIVESFDGDESCANSKEIFWIKTYMSNINKWPEGNGMNQTDGGVSIKGYKFSSECVEKRAIKNRGLKKPFHVVEATRLRYLGKTFTQDHRKNISSGMMKPILMYDMSMNFVKEFNSIDEAYAFLGKKKCGHIGSVCKGGRHHIYKHIFKYKNDVP